MSWRDIALVLTAGALLVAIVVLLLVAVAVALDVKRQLREHEEAERHRRTTARVAEQERIIANLR